MSIMLKLVIWLCLFAHGCSKPIPDDKYTPTDNTVEWDIENNLPTKENPVTSEYKRNKICREKCAKRDSCNENNNDCDECDESYTTNDCCGKMSQQTSGKNPSTGSPVMSKTNICEDKPCNTSTGGDTSLQKSDNTPCYENTNDCDDTPENTDDCNDPPNEEEDDCDDNINDCEGAPDNDNECEDSQYHCLEDHSPCGENADSNPPIDVNTICNPPCDVAGGDNCFDVHEHHHYHHHQPCCISIHHEHCHFHHHHHHHCHCHRLGCCCRYDNYKTTKLCPCCKHNNVNNNGNNLGTDLQRDNTNNQTSLTYNDNNLGTDLQRDNTNNQTSLTYNDTMISNNSIIVRTNNNENIQTLEGNNSRIGGTKRGCVTVALQ